MPNRDVLLNAKLVLMLFVHKSWLTTAYLTEQAVEQDSFDLLVASCGTRFGPGALPAAAPPQSPASTAPAPTPASRPGCLSS